MTDTASVVEVEVVGVDMSRLVDGPGVVAWGRVFPGLSVSF